MSRLWATFFISSFVALVYARYGQEVPTLRQVYENINEIERFLENKNQASSFLQSSSTVQWSNLVEIHPEEHKSLYESVHEGHFAPDAGSSNVWRVIDNYNPGISLQHVCIGGPGGMNQHYDDEEQTEFAESVAEEMRETEGYHLSEYQDAYDKGYLWCCRD